MKSLIAGALFLTSIFSYANDCNGPFEYFSARKLVGDTRQSCYKDGYCGDNIFKLIQEINAQGSEGKDFVDQSDVLIIFHKNFEVLMPQYMGMKEGEGWGHHVILNSPQGILDFDDHAVYATAAYQYKEMAFTYFRKYFPEESRGGNIMIHRIPARKYFQRKVAQKWKVELPLAIPTGWLQKESEQYLRNDNLYVTEGNVIYYLLSQDYNERYPAIPLEDYLSEPQPAAKLPTF